MPIYPYSRADLTRSPWSRYAAATAILRPSRDGTGGVPSLRYPRQEFMQFAALRYLSEDPGSLVESCQKALEWILWKHGDRPITRCWIDAPYTAEEIDLLEQEVLPAMEHFLRRMAEVDARLEAAQSSPQELALQA